MAEKPKFIPKLIQERRRVYEALVKVRDGDIIIVTPSKEGFNASTDIDMVQLAKDLSRLQGRFPKKLWLNIPLHTDDESMTLLTLYRDISKRAEEDRQTYLQQSKAARHIRAQRTAKGLEDLGPFKQDPLQHERFGARVSAAQTLKTFIIVDLEQSGLIKPTFVDSDDRMHGKAMDHAVDAALSSKQSTPKGVRVKPITPESMTPDDEAAKSWIHRDAKRRKVQDSKSDDKNDSKIR